MNESRHSIYVSPNLPYVLKWGGGLLLFLGFMQIVLLIVFVSKVLLGLVPWQHNELGGSVVRVLVYLVLGRYAFVGGQALLAAKADEARLRQLHRDQPWLRNKQWAQGHIRDEDPVIPILFTVAMVCLLALLAYFIRLIVVSEPAERPYGIALGVVLTIYVLVQGFLLNRKWRKSALRLGTIPGIIGGPLEAVVVLNEAVVDGTPFRVTLTCEKVQWRRTCTVSTGARDDDDTQIIVRKIWQDDHVVDKFLDTGMKGKTGIPVYFAIPYDSKPTTMDDVQHQGNLHATRWILTVTRDDLADFRSVQFQVPVFLTPASSPDYREDTTVLRPYAELVTPESVLAQMVFHCESIPGGERLWFSLRRWNLILAGSVLSLCCAVGTVAAWTYLTPWVLCLIASMVPAAIFAVSTLGILEMLLWQSEVVITGETVDITAGYPYFRKQLSLPRRQAVVLESQVEFTTAVSEFRCLQIGSSRIRSHGGAGTQPDSPAISTPGQVTVIKRLPGRQKAETIRRWLANRIHE